MGSRKFRQFAGISLLAVAATAQPAYAQEAAAPAQPEREDHQATEQEAIIVTATRRNTELQRTPVAVTALGAETIETQAPSSILGLASLIPNFSVSNISGQNSASLSLRGRGLALAQAYQEAPVAVIVDDFVVPHPQSQQLDTFDVENLQVLRGPQGTLFGKNSTAGAVVVTTKRPSLTDSSVEAQFGFGSWNERTLKAGVNVPLVEGRLGLRLVGAYRKDDGYYHNNGSYGPIVAAAGATTQYNGLTGQGDGKRVGGKDIFNGRIKLLAEPTDNLTLLLQYEHLRDFSDTPRNINISFPGQRYNSLGFVPQTDNDPLDRAASPQRAGFLLDLFKTQQLVQNGYFANLDWKTGIGTFSSVTGYSSEDTALPNSFSGVDVEGLTVLANNYVIDRKIFSQEFRLAGDIGNNVDYVVGTFFQKGRTNFCQAGISGLNDLLAPLSTVPFPGGANNNPRIVCNRERARGYAGFMDVSWRPTPEITISGGIRYTHEKKKFTARNEVYIQDLGPTRDPAFTWDKLGEIRNAFDFVKYPGAAGIGAVVEDEQSWGNPTYHLTASYQATDTLYLYGSFAHGFKSGGYNNQIGRAGRLIADDEKRPYNEESVDSFELGFKSDLLDRRLRLNVTAFHAKYSDLQIFTIRSITLPNGAPGSANLLTNASSGKVKGIELEANAIISDRLRLNVVGGYLDTAFGTFAKNPTLILTGKPLERAPKWQGSTNIYYTLPLGQSGEILFNAAVTYEDKSVFVYSDVIADYDILVPSKTLVNGSITYKTSDERFYGRLLVRNLFDKRYLHSGGSISTVFAYGSYGDPRFVGVQLGTKF